MTRIQSVTPPGEQRGRLQDATTGATFVPRGSNYIRLAPASVEYHATFEPGRYAPDAVEAALTQMQHDGYNTVRVFIDPGSIPDAQRGQPHGVGRGVNDHGALYAPYMDNVADFLRRADAHCVRAILSLDAFPQNARSYGIVGPFDPASINIDGHNLFYLHEGHVRAKEDYLRNFVAGLRDRLGADRLSVVLAYETDNEAFMVADKAPFNRMSGTVQTIDGHTYDMAVPAQRQQAQDANFVSYAIRMVNAVKSVDSNAMVTMGMFTFRAVGKPGPNGLLTACETACDPNVDYRYPARPWALSHFSTLSFLDIHTYPVNRAGDPYTLENDLRSSEWSQVIGTTITGEYGAFKFEYQNDITAAAYGMRDLQVNGCQLGLAGWVFWTYDTTETADQQRLFTLTDQGGAINGQLAPIVRPDPCSRDLQPATTSGSCARVASTGPGTAPAPGQAQPRKRRRIWIKVTPTSLRQALRRGLRVTVHVPARGRIIVSARRRQTLAARKRTKARRATTRQLRLRFNRRARARWAGARRLTLTVQLTFVPNRKGARPISARTRVTLRR